MKALNCALTILILLATGQLTGQSLQRFVVGSTGVATQNAELAISFTVGETIVSGYVNESLHLQSGFQQAAMAPITSAEERGDVPGIAAYPNPVRAELFLETRTDAHGTWWEMFDIVGRLVYSGRHSSETGSARQRIDVGHLLPGMYFLVIRTGPGRLVKTFKMEKIR